MKKSSAIVFVPAALFFILASTVFGQDKDGGIYAPGLPNNTLTDAEKADGYQLLWNGKDYTGWGVNDPQNKGGTPGSNWAIVTIKGFESGDTHKSINPDSNMLEVTNPGPSIFTLDSSYRDFDWKMEWQSVVGAQGNSGMLYHYRIDASVDNNLSAPEYQLCNKEWTSEWTATTTSPGCDYDMLGLIPSVKNPDNSPTWCRAEGHWNQSRVISFGTRTAHFGNGLRLMEYQMFSAVWQAAYDQSKYKPKQGSTGVYAKLHNGSFYVQDHGQKSMKFRNIRVKRLTKNPWAPDSPYLNKTAAAKGDSTLIDTLLFTQDLFPATSDFARNPYMIVPKIGTQISVNANGVYIAFSQAGNYSVSIEDPLGVTYDSRSVHGSQAFVPGRFYNHPQILTIWNGAEKIHESVITAK